MGPGGALLVGALVGWVGQGGAWWMGALLGLLGPGGWVAG